MKITIGQAECLIKQTISSNGRNLITGQILQDILIAMLESVRNEVNSISNDLYITDVDSSDGEITFTYSDCTTKTVMAGSGEGCSCTGTGITNISSKTEGGITTITFELSNGKTFPIRIKETNAWTIGEDGYWYVNGEKTEYKAVANENSWTIGEDGYWYKDGVKTEYRAVPENECKCGNGIKDITFDSTNTQYVVTFDDDSTKNIPAVAGGNGTIIEIGENGNWYRDGVDTGVKASCDCDMEYIKKYLLTDMMKDYLEEQLYDKIQKEAESKYFVTTTITTPTTYYAEETKVSDIKNTVTVKLTYDGVEGVKADTKPVGWTENVNGTYYTYTKTLNNTTKSVAQTEFTYTVPEDVEIYGGHTLKKKSDAKSISVIYPAYYGFINAETVQLFTNTPSPTNDGNDNEYSDVLAARGNKLPEFTRIIKDVNFTATQPNPYDEVCYFCIVTNNSAEAKQFGLSIMQAPTSFVFRSSTNPDITLSNYKLYISEKSVEANGELTSLTLNIKI